MQGTFYGAFQGRKRDMLPLLSKLGEKRHDNSHMWGEIFRQLRLSDNWETAGEEDWVKAQYSSTCSMTINYLEGDLFSDLSSYMLRIEALICTRTLDYGVNTYIYSPYDSLVIQSFERKAELQDAARPFERETDQASITRDKQKWGEYYEANAAAMIPDEVFPPPFYSESLFLIRDGVLQSYTGREEEVVIPDECTLIGARAFRENQWLRRVVIPGSVREIGESAFADCRALEQAVLSQGLERIGKFAFSGTALREVAFPKGLTHIDDFAFYDTDLKRAELPEGLVFLGFGAFKKHLKDKVMLRIPSTLQSLREEIHDTVLSDLAGVEVAEDHPTYANYDRVLYRKTDGTLLRAPEDLKGTFEIPAGVKRIKNYAFWCVRELTGIRIPIGVTEIEDDAFGGCWKLKEVALPEGLVKIGRNAFSYCKALSSVQLPKSLRQIDSRAFSGCKELKRLELPDGLEKCGRIMTMNRIPEADFGETATILSADLCVKPIQQLMFVHPVELRLARGKDYMGLVTPAVLELLIEQDDPQSFSIAEPFVSELWEWLPDLIRHARFCGATHMEAYLQELEQAGIDCGKKHKPATAAQLKKQWFFRDNKNGTLTARASRSGFLHVILPEQVGKNRVIAFEGESHLSGKTFDNNRIRTLTLPSSLEQIKLTGMTSLEWVEVMEEDGRFPSGGFSSKDGILYADNGRTLLRCPQAWKGGCVVVGEDVAAMAYGAFSGCRFVTEFRLPGRMKLIESFAFYECRNLRKVTISEGTEKLGTNLFGSCPSLEVVTLPASIKEMDEDLWRVTGGDGGYVLRAPSGSLAEKIARKNLGKYNFTFEPI